MIYVESVHRKNMKKKVPEFYPGDTIKVHQKIKEGNKERIQLFMGTVIARNNKGISRTFTVRKISFGVGVEKVFPLYSPNIEKIEIVKHGKVSRAKLYYLRERVGKKSRVLEKKRIKQDVDVEKISAEGFEDAAMSAPSSAVAVSSLSASVSAAAPTSALSTASSTSALASTL